MPSARVAPTGLLLREEEVAVPALKEARGVMGHKYSEIVFTDTVKAVQKRMGSRVPYARREGGPDTNDRLGPNEGAFIATRDSFYIASVSETGWPYVQFRGGPPGFLRVLDESTLGYADFRGNKQYITTGNVISNDHVSLFLMDYAHRERLKILGHMAVTDARDNPEIIAQLVIPDYPARVERAVLITVAAFDWNCPQHITPRFTQDELVEALAPIRQEMALLRAENGRLRRQAAGLQRKPVQRRKPPGIVK
jgi:predicted pyridoxine 5'-phosphate oxidase superfamily flavin-nucleotide-binding protein